MFLICLVYYKTCFETKSLKIKLLGLPDFVPSGIGLMGSELQCCLPCSGHHVKSFFISAPIPRRNVWCLNVDRVDVSLRCTCPSCNSKKIQRNNVSDGGSRGFGASRPIQRPGNFGFRKSRVADFHCCGAPPFFRKTKGSSSSIFGKMQQFLAFSG